MNTQKICDAVTKIIGADTVKWHLSEDLRLTVNENEYRLTPWRFDRRMLTMRHLTVEENRLRKNCSYKSVLVDTYSADLKKALYIELDMCRWLLDDEIISVYAIGDGEKILSAVLRTQKGVLCNIELAATLSEQTTPVTRHEVVGKEGMISDRSINEQVPFESVYLFENDKKHPLSYTEMDMALPWLDKNEVAVADNIIAFLENPPEIDELKKNDEILSCLVGCVFESLKTGEVIKMEGKEV